MEPVSLKDRPFRIFDVWKQVSHILRQRSREFKLLPGRRVGKAQIGGMKRLAVDQTVIRAVEKIPRQWVPDGFHMDADLVCSSRLQQEADEREVGVLVVCDGLIMGHGSLTPAPDRRRAQW